MIICFREMEGRGKKKKKASLFRFDYEPGTMPEKKKNSPVQQQVMKRRQKKSLVSPHGAMSGH